MIRKYALFTFIFLLFSALSLHAGQMIDRIVATVNGHIILQSDWDDAVRCEAVMNGHTQEPATAQQRKEVLDRLIDQELLREQIPPQQTIATNSADVMHRLDEIKKFYNHGSDVQAWNQILAQYQVTEDEIKSRVALQMELMQVVDSHLRPKIEIDQKSVESYYNQDLLPQLRREGSPAVPLAKAAPQIKEILTQQKMNQLLVAWLQNLRAGSTIATNPSDTGEQAR